MDKAIIQRSFVLSKLKVSVATPTAIAGAGNTTFGTVTHDHHCAMANEGEAQKKVNMRPADSTTKLPEIGSYDVDKSFMPLGRQILNNPQSRDHGEDPLIGLGFAEHPPWKHLSSTLLVQIYKHLSNTQIAHAESTLGKDGAQSKMTQVV